MRLLDIPLVVLAGEAFLLRRERALHANFAAGGALLAVARCAGGGKRARRLVVPLLGLALLAHAADLQARRRPWARA